MNAAISLCLEDQLRMKTTSSMICVCNDVVSDCSCPPRAWMCAVAWCFHLARPGTWRLVNTPTHHLVVCRARVGLWSPSPEKEEKPAVNSREETTQSETKKERS